MANKLPIKPNGTQSTLLTASVGGIYDDILQELFISLVRAINKRGTIDLEQNPYLWQLQKANEMHALNKSNINLVLERTGLARETLERVIKSEGLKVYDDTATALKKGGKTAPPATSNATAGLESIINQTRGDLDNFVNQSLIATNLGKNTVMRTYNRILDEVAAKVAAGTATKEQAIRSTIYKFSKLGFTSGFVDAGGRTWSIQNYVRTTLQTTTYRVYNDTRTRVAEEYGVNTFYYSKNPASRKACAGIQGKIVTKGPGFYSNELKSEVISLEAHGYGTAGGALGINCHHTITPFIIGVNYKPEESDSTKGITEAQAVKNGQKQAQQRKIEREIRGAKLQAKIARELDDVERYTEAMEAGNRATAQMNKLLKENTFLHRDKRREVLYN